MRLHYMNWYGLLLRGVGGCIGLGPEVAKETRVSIMKLQTGGEEIIKIREQKLKKGERGGKLVMYSDWTTQTPHPSRKVDTELQLRLSI